MVVPRNNQPTLNSVDETINLLNKLEQTKRKIWARNWKGQTTWVMEDGTKRTKQTTRRVAKQIGHAAANTTIVRPASVSHRTLETHSVK